jgi:hypothetical protein
VAGIRSPELDGCLEPEARQGMLDFPPILLLIRMKVRTITGAQTGVISGSGSRAVSGQWVVQTIKNSPVFHQTAGRIPPMPAAGETVSGRHASGRLAFSAIRNRRLIARAINSATWRIARIAITFPARLETFNPPAVRQ